MLNGFLQVSSFALPDVILSSTSPIFFMMVEIVVRQLAKVRTTIFVGLRRAHQDLLDTLDSTIVKTQTKFVNLVGKR